jgi:hypothetical protein
VKLAHKSGGAWVRVNQFVDRRHVRNRGLGDGVLGLIKAMFTAYSVFLKFSEVWERNNTNRRIRYEPIP